MQTSEMNKYRLLFPPQPAVLDNLLTSMKFVLRGMGMLRINLANKNNKVTKDEEKVYKICFY